VLPLRVLVFFFDLHSVTVEHPRENFSFAVNLSSFPRSVFSDRSVLLLRCPRPRLQQIHSVGLAGIRLQEISMAHGNRLCELLGQFLVAAGSTPVEWCQRDLLEVVMPKGIEKPNRGGFSGQLSCQL
jgi:hypothetical protein